MSFSDKIKELVKDAPVARGTVNVNYGAMTVTPMVITFHGQGRTPDKHTLQEFAEEQGVEVDEVEFGDNDQLQLHFAINVKELNPSLSFESVERDVAVLKSGQKVKTDWQEIVLPALIQVFGKNWDEILFGRNGKSAKPIYVAAEMVDSLRTPKVDPETGQPGKNYGVPKLIAKYDSREDCEQARDERYGPRTDSASESEDELVSEDEGEFPDKVLRQVWALYRGNKKSKPNTLAFIKKNKAWKEYDADELFKAAVKAGEEGEFDS